MIQINTMNTIIQIHKNSWVIRCGTVYYWNDGLNCIGQIRIIRMYIHWFIVQ